MPTLEPPSDGVNTPPHPQPNTIVSSVACPACKAAKGFVCYTPIDGVDTQWTHDARVFAYMGVRGDA